MLTEQIRNIILRCESEMYICNKSSSSSSSPGASGGMEVIDPLVAVEPISLQDILDFSNMLSEVGFSSTIFSVFSTMGSLEVMRNKTLHLSFKGK